MGDLIGDAVKGKLYYISRVESARVMDIGTNKENVAKIFANVCRINVLYMIAKAGSGHIGSSFSSLDIMSWLFLNEMRVPKIEDTNTPRDVFFSSKGHDAPAYYSVLIGLGLLEEKNIHLLRRTDGLPGHPDITTPNIETNTGSLGMGISKAKGMAHANRLAGRSSKIYVLTGDGELQEGQIWESLGSAVNNKFGEITVIVDHNKLQSDTLVSKVSDLGDLEAKFASFGWHVKRCDGNDPQALQETFSRLKNVVDTPKVIIADTIKGYGVSFMQHTSIDSDVEMYRFHSGAPDAESYTLAVQELIDSTNEMLAQVGSRQLELDVVSNIIPANNTTLPMQKMVGAYSRALMKQAEQNKEIVALDADLVLDTGLIPFQDKYPERFVECGIAEQDMVSQAGGMALKGRLPVVHSFACFLSARPNEHIYNNATERTKIIYVGSLAGVLPGGPGHSHQSLRDISALGSVPGLSIIEPCDENEVIMALDFAINNNTRSTYLRLVSIPCAIPYELPAGYEMEPGKGVVLRNGSDITIIGYGPVLLTEAFHAAELIEKQSNMSVKVVNLPWLNQVDGDWLVEAVKGNSVICTLDNHYIIGGQGQAVAAALAMHSSEKMPRIRLFGIEDIPACGRNDEVLKAHGLNAESLATNIMDMF